jgi:hypothetical protein
MPISEKLSLQVTQIQDNFALLSKWIEGLESLLDVELIEAHLNTLKDVCTHNLTTRIVLQSLGVKLLRAHLLYTHAHFTSTPK